MTSTSTSNQVTVGPTRVLDAPDPSSVARVRRDFVGGLFWAMLGTAFAQGSTFLSSIIAARVLGQAEFGKLALLQSAAAMLGGFAAMGLGTTATKFVAELRGRAPDRVGRILGLCTVATAITGAVFAGALVAAAPEASALLRIVGLETQLRLGAIHVLFFTLNAFQIGALSGFGAFSTLARIGAIQGVVAIVLMALGTWSLGLSGGILALGAGAACAWLQYQVAIRDLCRRHGTTLRYAGFGQELPVLSNFAAPAALSGCVGGLAGLMANTVLVRQAGVQEMATFTAANTIRILVLFVPGLVSRVSSPFLCRLEGAGQRATFRQAWWRYLSVNSLLAGGAALVLFAAGPLLLRLWGKAFVEGRTALGLLLAAAVAETVSVALFQTLYTHGRIWAQFGIGSLWAMVLVGITRRWAGTYGASALAAAYLLAWSCSTVLYAAVARGLLTREPAEDPGRTGT